MEMQAISTEGQESKVITDYILKVIFIFSNCFSYVRAIERLEKLFICL